jgi:hypothetical protein
MRARLAMMQIQMWMRRQKHSKLMMDQCRMSRTALGTSDVVGNQCTVGEDADTDEYEEASQANIGSRQNVVD